MFLVMAVFDSEIMSLVLLSLMGSAGLIGLFRSLCEKGG